MTDPISDFLTHLRNASKAGLAQCVSPHSKLKESLATILKAEGFVRDVTTGTDENGHKTVVVTMKYVDNVPVLTGLKRSSTPGRRLYTGYADIRRSTYCYIISESTDRQLQLLLLLLLLQRGALLQFLLLLLLLLRLGLLLVLVQQSALRPEVACLPRE